MLSYRILPLAAAVLALTSTASAISLVQLNTPVSENFDTLAATGTSSAVPAGWSFVEAGTGANTTYSAATGSSTTGDTYSFGAAGSTERAFGTLLTGSLASTLSVQFTNDTGVVLTQLAIAYTGEQWRLGATGRTDRLDFAYSLDGATWVDVDLLDFLAPNSAGTVGALDGNAAANRVAISSTLSGLSITPGAAFWLRWSDFAAAGSDDGLAIDDFSLTPLGSETPTSNPVPDQLPLGLVALLLAGLLRCRWCSRGR